MNIQEHNQKTKEAILTLILESKTLEQLKNRCEATSALIKNLPKEDKDYLRTMYISRMEAIKEDSKHKESHLKEKYKNENQSSGD